MSEGTPAEATTPSRSFRMSRRCVVSSAQAAAAAVAAPSLPLWKLLSAGRSDCQATCGAPNSEGELFSCSAVQMPAPPL